MGLLDLFSGKGAKSGDKTEKLISKHTSKLTNQSVQHEDRLAAAEALAAIEGGESILGLLRRYDMTLDKGYMDQNEKAFVRDLIVARGKEAIAPIEQFMKLSDNVNWPERILTYVVTSEAEVVGTLLRVVESERDGGDMKGPKRAKLLGLLVRYHDKRITSVAAPFLADFDESVRFTAIEVIDAQGDLDSLEFLVKHVLESAEDSIRVRQRVFESLAHHRWNLNRWSEAIAAQLPAGFKLENDCVIEIGRTE